MTVSSSVAPLFCVCDPRTGACGRAREVFPSAGGRGVAGVINSVVVAQHLLALLVHQPKDAQVAVAHDRTPPGPGGTLETACVGELVGELLWSDEPEAEGARQAGDWVRHPTAFGARDDVGRGGGGEAQPAVWAAEVGHG